MTCGIYMIQNKVNGKIYIGQAVDIKKRWKDHKCELRGNYHDNGHLQRAWNKYREDNFEFSVMCECNENQLNTMEEYYIFELMSYDRRVGYNKTYGGGSGRPTKESRKKMSEAQKGRTISEETKKKLSKASKIAMSRPEVRKKKSEAVKGEKNPNYGKHHSEEAKRKMSEAAQGKHHTEETKRKISEANKGELGAKCPTSIPVVQLTLEGELVNVYESAREAERNRGFNGSHITTCIKGRLKTHGGYKWMYLHEYIAKMNPNIKTINLFGKQYEVNQEEVKIGQEG